MSNKYTLISYPYFFPSLKIPTDIALQSRPRFFGKQFDYGLCVVMGMEVFADREYGVTYCTPLVKY